MQAQLKPATAARLKEAVPQISDKDLEQMMKVPFMRSFDPAIIQEPFVYRMVELMQHYGSGTKSYFLQNNSSSNSEVMFVYVCRPEANNEREERRRNH